MWKTKLAVERLNLQEEAESMRQSISDEEKRTHERLRMLRRQDAVRVGIPQLPKSAGSGGDSMMPSSNASPHDSMGSRASTSHAGGDRSSFGSTQAADPPSSSSGTGSHSPSATSVHRGRFRVMRDEVLGRGGFGVVFRGFDNERGEIVAVKETKMDPANRRQIRQALESEFTMLQQLDHANIVRVFALTPFNETVQIVMEWMPSGSVSDLMRKRAFRFHERVIHRYAIEALRGLAYLHTKGFLHRDIKPANMLVSGCGTLKLSDFGTCKQVLNKGLSAATTTMTGTPYYLSPEACNGFYSAGSDVWAVACSVVEMATGDYPWAHLPPEMHSPLCLVFHIGGPGRGENHHPRIPDHLSAELKALLKRCFDPEAAARPTAEELLETPYFAREASLPDDAESADAFSAEEASAQEEEASGTFTRDPSEALFGDGGGGGGGMSMPSALGLSY